MAQNPGTPYELALLERFGFQKTAGSGSVHGDGDLRHRCFLVEAKDHSKENFNLPRTDFLKMRRQALMHAGGQWVYFFRNAHGEQAVTMNIELFETLLGIADGGVECPECKTVVEVDW